MTTYRKILFLAFISIACQQQPEIILNEREVYRLPIPYTTGICYSRKDSIFYLVSSDGIIAKMNRKFEIIEKLAFPNNKFNGVFLDEAYIYLLTPKDLMILDLTNFKVIKSFNLANLVGSKAVFQTIFFNPFKRTFVIVSNEKKPKVIELEPTRFKIIKRGSIKGIQFIAGGTVLGRYLYLLNGRDQLIYKINLKQDNRLEITLHYSIYYASGLTFAEGIGFVIVSKELRRAFVFNDKIMLK